MSTDKPDAEEYQRLAKHSELSSQLSDARILQQAANDITAQDQHIQVLELERDALKSQIEECIDVVKRALRNLDDGYTKAAIANLTGLLMAKHLLEVGRGTYD